MSEVGEELSPAAPTPAPPAAPPPPPAAPAAPPPPPPAAPERDWLKGAGEEFRADPDLTRYETLDQALKGFKDTRAMARGRVPIPTDEAGFKELGEKLRPAKAEDYGIDFGGLATGDPELAGAFSEWAHATGLPKEWAQGAANFYTQRTTNAMMQLKEQNTQGIEAVKLDLGPVAYETRVQAVNNMMQAAGIDVFDVATGLQLAVGGEEGKPSGERVMRALFSLAEKFGEVEKVDASDVQLRLGSMTAEQASAEMRRMAEDKDSAAKLRDHTSAEYKKWEELQNAGGQL